MGDAWFGRDSGAEGPAPGGAAPPDGTRLYVVGDIHGCLDLLDRLHTKILADAEAAGAARQVIVYAGDYIDRGPDSRGVIDRLIGRPLPGFECVHLSGNHEAEMLRFLQGEEARMQWLDYGGIETLRSYGVNTVERWNVAQLEQSFAEAMPPAHLAFFRGLATRHIEGDFLVAHAGIRPGIPIEDQNEQDLMWIREPFLGSKAILPKIVVHGHTIAPEPEVRRNRIGIDTGAFRTGRLTAVALQAGRYRFLQTG